MKIKGLKKIAGESKHIGKYDPEYLQLNYDKTTGEAWTDYHYSIGCNSWCEYHDKNIVNCGYITEQKTMIEIAEMIHNAIFNNI